MGVSGTPRNRMQPVAIRQFVLISVLAGAIVAAMALPFVGTAAFAARQASVTFDALPQELKSLPLPQRTYLETNDGKVFATLYDENRIVVPLSKISPKIQEAAIATEDARFYEHNGVDLKGSARALVANSQAGDVQQGSSTITMQYVRNLLITNAENDDEIEQARARTIGRKLQEMRYAIAIEKKMTKEEILQGYLNVSYFGAGAYGVEAAAKRYFNTTAANVTLAQAATLAGLVQQPVGYDPTRNPDIAQVRRNVVLDRMELAGFITFAVAAKTKQIPMKKTLKPRQVDNGCSASDFPFYCDYAVSQIRNDPRYGETLEIRDELLRRGGLTIQTGLDLKAQQSAQEAVTDYIPEQDPSQKAAAIAMVEPGTGNVLALAQNRPWGTRGKYQTTYNYAVNAADGGTIGMQAGSTFKIFTLAAALEKGISPNEVIYSPQRKTFAAGDWGCGKNFNQPSYTVNNSTGSGNFNMWTGAARSVNTFFVELQRQAGLCRVVDVADRMGVTLGNGEKLNRYPSFTLGSMEVSPVAVAGAYAGFANHGEFCRPHAIDAVTDLNGSKLFQDNGSCSRAVSRSVADATTAILTGVVDGPISGRTGQKMSLGRDATGKTGTTDTSAAVWYAGYTPQIAAAVWSGDPRGGFKHPMDNVTINGSYYDEVYGSSLPGPIWRQAMLGALSGEPAENFDLEAKFNLRTARNGGVNGGSSYSTYTGDQSYDSEESSPYNFNFNFRR
ncbi:MAG: transglycosylase domain-containing protein [Actinobacteria bacterium]|nr:transglycosylase domain-containing protein [Actinomycetota bacterium]